MLYLNLREVAKTKPTISSQKNYEKTAKNLILFWGNDRITFQDIDEDFINRFKTFLSERVSQNTAYGYFSGFATTLKQAKRDKIIAHNPMDDIERLKQIEVIKAFLTLEELMRLYETECTHPEVKKVFLFECLTGLRQSDILYSKLKGFSFG